MTSTAEPAFPIIPQPLALAVDTLSRPFGLRRSPTPSRAVTMSCSTTDKSHSSNKSRQARAAAAADRRRSLFHEDVFSRLLGGPLSIFHFAFYCAVPLYYLAHYSPFSRFEAGPGPANQVVRWALLLLTQYLTVMLAVSWFGRYTVRKEVTALVFMATSVTLVAALKVMMDGLVVSRGW